mgnify:CR=1
MAPPCVHYPKAKLYHNLSFVGLAGFLLGLLAIFLVSLFTGLVIAALGLVLLVYASDQEKKAMVQASKQSQEVQARKDEAIERMKACRQYRTAKKEAEEKGISPADVQDLVAQLTMQS